MLSKQLVGIGGFYAASVEDAHRPRSLFTYLCQTGSQCGMNLLRLRGRCCLTGANRPNRFIGDDALRKLCSAEMLSYRIQLSQDNSLSFTRLTLSQ
jgi:hypothetical protein